MSSYGRGPNIFDLTRVANVMDFGADPTGNLSCTRAFIQAIHWLKTQQVLSGGIVLIPVGTFALGNEPAFVQARSHLIEVPDGIVFMGQGPQSIVQLRPTNVNKTLFKNSDPSGGNSDIAFYNFRINGNRDNNTAQLWQGIDMFNVTDLVIEGMEIDNCRGHGIAVDHCERFVIRENEIHDNGYSGIWASFSHRGKINDNHCYNNCRVDTAGNSDGIQLNNMAQDNRFWGNQCYDLSAFGGDPEGRVTTGKRQGYGVRESQNETVDRNHGEGNYLMENLTGQFLQDWGRSIVIGIDQTILPHNISGNA